MSFYFIAVEDVSGVFSFGKYSSFYKGFPVNLNNDLLYIKDVVDLDGNPIFGVFNSINFNDKISDSILFVLKRVGIRT